MLDLRIFRIAVFLLALTSVPVVGSGVAFAQEEDQADDDSSIDEALDEAEHQAEDPRGEASVINGTNETLSVSVISWRDLPFQTVKRQTFDYSCGSAAVATLLTYVYGRKTTESDVFRTMFADGDQKKIRREGFSLLDMSKYLNKLGYKASGYKLNLKIVEKHKIPFIALINRDGYMHFVVVKSVVGPAVLIGDPSKGNMIVPRDEFEKMWTGVSLVVKNNARAARSFFADAKEWSYAHPAAIPGMGEHPALDSVSLPFPNWQIAPTRLDTLSAINNFTSNVSNYTH